MKEIKGLFSNNLYSILISYYDLLRSKVDIVYNDEIKNQKNPFVKFFDNKSTILPLELKKLEIPPCKNDEIVDFMTKICEIKHFKLTSILQNNTVLTKNIDNFVNHYKSIELNLPNVSSIPQIPRISLTYYEIVRLISIQPNWVFRWISNREYFELLPEHANKILEVKNEIDSYQHDNFLCSDIDLDDYFISQYCQEKLFNKLLNDILSYENHQQFLSVCKLIKILSDNKVTLLSILDLLNRYLYDKKTQFNSSEPVNKLLKVLNNTVKFRNNFM